jgi:hypothetical protein
MPQPASPCHVDTWGEHRATRRTGYCDHHHGEYLAEKNRWRSALGNYRKGNTSKDPGPWDDRLPHIPFTEQDSITIHLTLQDRNYLRDLAQRTQQVSKQGNPSTHPNQPTSSYKPQGPNSQHTLNELVSTALSDIASGRSPTP